MEDEREEKGISGKGGTAMNLKEWENQRYNAKSRQSSLVKRKAKESGGS